MNLFTCRDLTDWLNDPFRTPPIIPDPVQLSFLPKLLEQAMPESTGLDLEIRMIRSQLVNFTRTAVPFLGSFEQRWPRIEYGVHGTAG